MADRGISPAARLVIAVVLAFGIAAVQGVAVLPWVILLAFAMVLASGHWRLVMRRMRGPVWLALGLGVVLPLASGTTVLAELGPLRLRMEGLQSAALIAGRLLCIVAVTLALLAPLGPFQLVAGLRSLRLPGLITDLALLTLRYLDEVTAELHRADLARQIRGGRRGWRALPEHAGLIATALIRAQARSDRLWAAMRLRGYGAGLAMPLAALRARDWLGMGAATVAALGVIWLDRAL